MRQRRIFRCLRSDDNPQQQKGSNGHLIFSGNDENHMRNGEILLEQRVSLFDGRTNPICCFTVDDLNSMNVNNNPTANVGRYSIYPGVWYKKSVMVKTFHDYASIERVCFEIAVATQMANHSSVHRLLGYCLNTKKPVLVYESPENGTLNDRILGNKEQNKDTLKWKDMLRIVWEIAHALSYLHTAFKRPIIHRDLKPENVYLDQDYSVRLSDFSLSISIPKGETHVDDAVVGTVGYVPPEYMSTGSVAESGDVYAFGILLLVLLTGKKPCFSEPNCSDCTFLCDWVRDCHDANKLGDNLHSAITTTEPADGPFDRQLEKLVELALRCASREEYCRPTMVDVAIELSNIISESSHPH